MANERKYLDYTGLQQFWTAAKDYFRTHPTAMAENLTNGISITVKDSRNASDVLGVLSWNGNTKAQTLTLLPPDVKTSGVLSYERSTGTLSIDLDDYMTSSQVEGAIAAATARAVNFKGVKSSKDELDSIEDPQAGDVYIVLGDSTETNKEYIYVPAADGEESGHFEELGFTVDLSGYYTKDEADNTFVKDTVYQNKVVDLEHEDDRLDHLVSDAVEDISDLEDRVTTVESTVSGLVDTANNLTGLISTLQDGLEDEIAAREQGDEDEAAARDVAIKDAFNDRVHIISYNSISGMFEETDVNTGEGLANAVEAAYYGKTVNVSDNISLTSPVKLDAAQNVVINLESDSKITNSTTVDRGAAFVLDDADAELLVVGDGEVGSVVGVWVKEGAVTIDGGNFTGSSRAVQLFNNDNSAKGQAFDSKVTVVINGGEFGSVEENSAFSTNQAGVVLFGGDLIINGGTFKNTWYCITGNGTDGWNHSNVTVNDGYFEATGDGSDMHAAAVYWPSDGVLTINGGTFKGGAAVYAKSGTVIINGGTFEATYAASADDVSKSYATEVGGRRTYQFNGSGFYCTGDAIIIDYCCNYPGGDPNVQINKAIHTSAVATDAHGVGIYYGRGVTPRTARGHVEIATGLVVDSHVYDLN